MSLKSNSKLNSRTSNVKFRPIEISLKQKPSELMTLSRPSVPNLKTSCVFFVRNSKVKSMQCANRIELSSKMPKRGSTDWRLVSHKKSMTE